MGEKRGNSMGDSKKVTLMGKNAKIYVAGHCGMVGLAIVHELRRQGNKI